MASIVKARELIGRWVAGEHDYQFKKFDDAYGADLKSRRDFILEKEVPNKWHQAALFRGDCTTEALHRSNQLILKTLAASRAALVYDECLAGKTREQASTQTFVMLSACLERAVELELPPRAWLYEPEYEVVFTSSSPEYTFERAAQLSLAALMELNIATVGDMCVPSPGLPTGPPEGFIR